MPARSEISLPGFSPADVQFYNIEIGRLADGMLGIAITATTCPSDGELATQELHCERTRTLDEALAVIRRTVVIQ